MMLSEFMEQAAKEGKPIYSISIFHGDGFTQLWFTTPPPVTHTPYQGHLFTLNLDKGEKIASQLREYFHLIHHPKIKVTTEEKPE